MFHHQIDFSKVSTNLVDFCKVVIGSTITMVSHSMPKTHIPALLEIHTIDLIINYFSTFITWTAGLLTSTVAIKTLSGKANIVEAVKYFKDYFKKGIINLFKKKGKN